MTTDAPADDATRSPLALIDELMPTWDVRERHRTRVRATAEATFAALHTADLSGAPLVRVLLALRALPAAVLGGRAAWRVLRQRGRQPATLRTFERHGFRVLAERPPREVAIGLEGRFWLPGGGVRDGVSTEYFRATAPPAGVARAVWDFTVRATGDGSVELATETRVRCGDAAARRRFLAYWAIVRPGSGVIRRLMLREIRRVAEGQR